MGDALVDQLVDRGAGERASPIFTSLTLEQLMELERMGKKSAEKILANIDASRKQPLPRVLNGLGIPFVGERTAQILARHFREPGRDCGSRSGNAAAGRRGGAEGGAQHPAVLP